MKSLKSKIKQNKNIWIMLILIVMLSFNFFTNFLSRDLIGGHGFKTFQADSENLVYGKMYYDVNQDVKGKCQYGLCIYTDYGKNNIYDVVDKKNIEFIGYPSQVGLQGYLFSFMHNKLNIKITIIRLIMCILLATVLCFISYLISKKYNKTLGIIFYITFFLSPWVIAFARNLYWVEFTWFLPALFSLLLLMNPKKIKIYLPLILISVFIKCLCGYEYLSVILLFAISFYIIDFFLEKNKEKRKKIFKLTVLVGIVCLLGFIFALLVHGYMRGNGNILDGVDKIYRQDVLRRTILTFDKDSYDGIYRQSMDASVFEVLYIYVYRWTTDIIYGINSKYFALISFLAIVICVIRMYQKDKKYKENIVMFLTFLITCISWYVLGKSHSYIHTHMNFVLWYFGYVQICLYIIFKYVLDVLKNFIKKQGYREVE